MVQYALYIYVRESVDNQIGIKDAKINVNGIISYTDINGDVEISSIYGGELNLNISKSGYNNYTIHEDYHDQNFVYFIYLEKSQCNPQPTCELDINGKNTGYIVDGCGGRDLNLTQCPKWVCAQIFECELDTNDNNTGYLLDSCGERELNLTQCPLSCNPNLVCELDSNRNNTGYILDGCGGKIEDLLNCPLPIICSQIICNFIIE